MIYGRENLTKILPEADFLLHGDSWKVKEMTKEVVQKQKRVFLKANF